MLLHIRDSFWSRWYVVCSEVGDLPGVLSANSSAIPRYAERETEQVRVLSDGSSAPMLESSTDGLKSLFKAQDTLYCRCYVLATSATDALDVLAGAGKSARVLQQLATQEHPRPKLFVQGQPLD